MAIPREQIYNDLTGVECKEILIQRFALLLSQNPLLNASHRTLPRVRMNLMVTLEMYADQPTPDVVTINDQCTLRVDDEREKELRGAGHTQERVTVKHSTVVDASPLSETPPDAVRVAHSIPVATPVPHPLGIGHHDQMETISLPGVSIERDFNSEMQTTVKIDQGNLRSREVKIADNPSALVIQLPHLQNKDRTLPPPLHLFDASGTVIERQGVPETTIDQMQREFDAAKPVTDLGDIDFWNG